MGITRCRPISRNGHEENQRQPLGVPKTRCSSYRYCIDIDIHIQIHIHVAAGKWWRIVERTTVISQRQYIRSIEPPSLLVNWKPVTTLDVVLLLALLYCQWPSSTYSCNPKVSYAARVAFSTLSCRERGCSNSMRAEIGKTFHSPMIILLTLTLIRTIILPITTMCLRVYS